MAIWLAVGVAIASVGCGSTTYEASQSASARATALQQGNTGIASRHPGDVGIGSDPDVIFADDFEGYTRGADLSNRWDNVFQRQYVDITTEAANVYLGSKALQFILPQQTASLGDATEKILSPEQDVLFLRYYSKIQPPYDVAGSMHDGASISAHYVVNGQATPGVPANGTNKFLANLENDRYDSAMPSPGHLNIYLYHPEQRDVYGDHFYPNGEVSPNTSLKFNYGPGFVSRPNIILKLDRWYCYEYMMQANTPGKRDGRIAIWVDGALVADFPGLRLRDVATLKIDRFGLSFYLGTNLKGEVRKWYDNVVAAKSYIGPISR
jgi:hypothetical protein